MRLLVDTPLSILRAHRSVPLFALLLAGGCGGPGISSPATLPLLVDVSVSDGSAARSGLRIVLDGVPAAELGADGGRVTLQVRTGWRTVELSGFAAECRVEDGPRRRVDVQPGRAAFVVSFRVFCPAD